MNRHKWLYTLLVATALLALGCGNECEDACERLFNCSPKAPYTAEDCKTGCDSGKYSDSWIKCIQDSACNTKLRSKCG